MKINSDVETLAENKVLILYVLSRSNKPITNDALYSIVQTGISINYFYFQQFLLDLMETKYIRSFEKETEKFYEITDEGKKTLDLTIDLLPGIIKLKIDTNFKDNIENIENADSIVAEFTPIEENKFEVEYKIIEKGEVVFSLKTFAYSRDQAQEMCEHWKKDAQNIYPEILKLLTWNK